MIRAPLADGIVDRAMEAGLVRIGVHDLRAFTDDRHRTGDDAPFGGGPGMVMKAEPFLRAVDALGARGRARGARSCCSRRAGKPLRPGDGRRATPRSIASCCCAAATRGSTSACARRWPPKR